MISDNLINLIKKSEGFSATPYQDSVGIWTIGMGFTHYPNYKPVTADSPPVTEDEANEWLSQLIDQFQAAVVALCPNCNQNQQDSLTDFAYNLGINALKGSTLLRLVLANPNDPAIYKQFMLWVYAGGEVLPGLVTRRKLESQLYFTPIQQA